MNFLPLETWQLLTPYVPLLPGHSHEPTNSPTILGACFSGVVSVQPSLPFLFPATTLPQVLISNYLETDLK